MAVANHTQSIRQPSRHCRKALKDPGRFSAKSIRDEGSRNYSVKGKNTITCATVNTSLGGVGRKQSTCRIRIPFDLGI